MVQTFNNFFVDIAPVLKINYNKNFLIDTDNQEDPILVIIEKFKNHPSVLVIYTKYSKNMTFSFALVTND